MTLRKWLRGQAKLLQSRSRIAAFALKSIYFVIGLGEIFLAAVFFASANRKPEDYAPDFICIGAQKSGTSWLDTLLRLHPDIVMPKNRKEVHYYDSGFWKGRNWYSWNFRQGSQSSFRGDITPAYCTLPKERIKEMADLNQDAHIFIILRNPVERAWSMAYMDLVKTPNRTLEEISDDVFAAHFKHRKSIRRGQYSRTIKMYTEVFGGRAPDVFFYDDLCTNPGGFLKQILGVIGADPDLMPDSRLLASRENVGGVHIPERFKPSLAELYNAELSELRALIDSSRWPNWLRE